MLCPGQVYETVFTAKDLDLAPGSVTLTVTLPDRSVDVAVVTGPVVSGRDYIYTCDYLLDTPGWYRFAWSSTSPGTAPPPETVAVGDYASMITKADAKEHLNITSDVYDSELSRFMAAATEVVETKGGYSVPRQFTDRVTDTGAYLMVTRTPVLSVESVKSVWSGGPSWTGGQLAVDGEAGIVYQPGFAAQPFWYPPFDVLYTVGRAVPLERHLHAVKEQLRHLWDTQRGSVPAGAFGAEDTFTTTAGWSFSVPRRVLELLDEDTPVGP